MSGTDASSGARAGMVAAVRERLVFGFNTFYGDLLSSVAKSDDLVKKRLKKGYRVLDRKSDAYLLDFYKSAKALGTLERVFGEDEGCEEDERVAGLLVARGLRFGELPAGEFPAVRLLCAVAWLFGELCDAAEEREEDREAAVTAVNELFERLVESVSRIQAGLPWGSGLEGLVDEEARGVFRATLTRLAGAGAGSGGPSRLSEEEVGSVSSAFDMMKCTKLGSIVQEISESIDRDTLKQAMDSGDLLGEGNMDMMGTLFKKVSGAISGRLQSGEISQDDLLRETSSLMSSMKGLM